MSADPRGPSGTGGGWCPYWHRGWHVWGVVWRSPRHGDLLRCACGATAHV